MRFLKGLVVLALAITVTGLVYAETQSVKISGDIDIKSFLRGNYDLNHDSAEQVAIRTGNQDDWQDYFMTQTQIKIEADLTDNVVGMIGLFNQRDWNVRAKSLQATTFVDQGYTMDVDEFEVGINLAYIELKEFLYSPLTLKIGRQKMWFGQGFVVGSNQRDTAANINAHEYTVDDAFDGIRATLDFDPWTIDAIAVRIWENDIQSEDNQDLVGVNIGYTFDVYNAETEGYWFYKNDNASLENWNIKDGNTIHTMGLRGSLDPIENWTAGGEIAWQWGQYLGSRQQIERRDRSAWAVDAMIECRHFQQQYSWKPKMGVEYVFYSGNKNIADETPYSTGTYTGWDVMYRGKTFSAIREWQGVYYLTHQDMNNMRQDVASVYPDSSLSNQHQVVVSGQIQPTDTLTLDCRYINFWQQYETYHIDVNSAPMGQRIKDSKYLGSEIDLSAKWDYTEDVSFGLLAAWYFPGSHYYHQSDDIAQDIVGSVKLSF